MARRKEHHRENSRQWHAKWQQKGVPKDDSGAKPVTAEPSAEPETAEPSAPEETQKEADADPFPKYEPIIDPDALEEAWP